MRLHARLWLAAAFALFAAVAGARDGGPSAAQREPVAGKVERNVAVPMRDGVILRADVSRPAADRRVPTLVYRTPYGKTATSDSSMV